MTFLSNLYLQNALYDDLELRIDQWCILSIFPSEMTCDELIILPLYVHHSDIEVNKKNEIVVE